MHIHQAVNFDQHGDGLVQTALETVSVREKRIHYLCWLGRCTEAGCLRGQSVKVINAALGVPIFAHDRVEMLLLPARCDLSSRPVQEYGLYGVR